ncbi:hypothetical protein [Pseudoalteromonas luteoviolacea]|uniref:Uncharacterized protein n=1 Tax=Pseudoalteromonas luteoviolacea DSM 6061 TaxID=1365250 RepID=A0A167D9S3_9GAMM|nr:hypothetical protein [Pseudoalteromonas luteoviolacea]KZN48586.1 hypothetical protein N475_06040 [Pseudoalteromonas luteoviolacea DSM 6061]KZN49252.1 hypothetical protein N474_24820 [Pseudoalteromonas luteoviolacea CPMOR-2]MBE0388712.1 hypothetical protein [Pseudoalteromonas luteoviolacea DSM 6061]TQF70153.1 hypothetical protein FLM44_03405 [Pseudoalteromonas luteoviolacea]
MHKLKLLGFIAIGIFPFSALANLPTLYSELTIKLIETWPNATSPEYGYTVILNEQMPNTGCSNNDRFVVEAGDFQDDTLSILLSAMMANKKIHVRVARCTDRPVVDRVAILNH